VMMYLTIGLGIIRWLTGTLGTVVDPPEMEFAQTLQTVTPFLLLKAFASGTSAVTGVEAIADGVPAFREPRSRNAGITLLMMACILGSLMLAITILAHQVSALPSESETLISQLARTVYGERGILYLMTIAATMIILVMAANTAFADFPRLSAIAATDGFLPRQLTYRGSRLVYSRGIMALAFIASGLIIVFQASVTRLIPLYAIGVFVSFTLSQAGMARRWWKSGHLKAGEEKVERGSTLRFDPGWKYKMVINGFGASVTAVIAFVFGATKFTDGAWIVIILIPLQVFIFSSIHHHYRSVAERLSLEHFGAHPRISRHRVILLVGGVHRGSLAALRYARTLSDDITAVYVSIDPNEAAKIQKKWEIWGEGVRLVILDSPYRLFLEPLLEYIEEIDEQRQANEIITVVVPQFVPRHWWARFLHARTADTLRKVLLNRTEIVITEVPYEVH